MELYQLPFLELSNRELVNELACTDRQQLPLSSYEGNIFNPFEQIDSENHNDPQADNFFNNLISFNVSNHFFENEFKLNPIQAGGGSKRPAAFHFFYYS